MFIVTVTTENHFKIQTYPVISVVKVSDYYFSVKVRSKSGNVRNDRFTLDPDFEGKIIRVEIDDVSDDVTSRKTLLEGEVERV